MVLRELSLNSVAVILFCILISCNQVPDQVKSTDDMLRKERGVYYYFDDPYTGTLIELDSNNICTAEIALENGIKNGESVYFFPDGKIKRTAEYKNGVYHGEVVQYFQNGKILSKFNYTDGNEEGFQQMWKSDGRLKVNYQVINGRKYGLTGVKNCLNVYEDTDSFH